MFGSITVSNGHNIFGGSVVGAAPGDLAGIAPGTIFASLDPETGGGLANADGIVPLRNSVANPALSGGDPLAAMPTDQIGVARPLPTTSLPDIGAAERNSTPSTASSVNNDVLTGTSTANTMSGNAGSDILRGLGGNDTLRGGSRGDLLDGGTGNDKLNGDNGIDLVPTPRQRTRLRSTCAAMRLTTRTPRRAAARPTH